MKKMYTFIKMTVAAFILLSVSTTFAQTNPVAVNDTLTIKKYHNARINVLQNDYDPEGHEIDILYINNSGNGYGYQFADSLIRYENTKTHGWDSLKYTIVRENDWEAHATAWLYANVIENELPDFTTGPPTVMAGEVVEINIYDVAADPDEDNFFVRGLSHPEHGEDLDYSDSTFSFIITENYSGQDSCMVKMTEANPDFSFAKYFVFNVQINPEFPVAVNDTAIAYPGDTVYIPVLQNDFDPQNDAVKIYDIDNHTLNDYFSYNDSAIILVPRANRYPGFQMAFSYQIAETDNPDHISNWAQGFLNIHHNPNLPVAVNDTVSVMAGIPVDIPVLLNDSDDNGDTLIISYANPGESLGVATHTDSTVTFTALCNLSGPYSFLYKIQEKHNEAHYASGRIIVNVSENPHQPIAVNDTVHIQGLQTIEFNPLLNDIGLENLDIKLDPIYQNATFVRCQVLSDSIVSLQVRSNSTTTIDIPYSFYQINNPVMVSNEAKMVIHITPDESMIYSVNDTIRALPGQSGMINLIKNDFNPGSDTILIDHVQNITGMKLTKVNDSVVQYNIGFSVSSPLQTFYQLTDLHDSIHSAGFIYLDINKPTSLIDTLDINHIRASFGATGMHFYDPVNEKGFFEAPSGSGKNTLYQQSLWVGGKSDYALHVAAETWHMYGNDFWPGPVSEIYQNEDMARYKMWKISREEIDYHIAHYKDPDYEPIESIATWPGNGNPELGQAEQLAPFFDQNDDGIYDPYDGDVPLIRGDQSLYFIFNDDYGSHTESGGVPMKIEIHGNAYAFDQPDDSTLFNTIFLHYDFYNRSENTYEDTYIGMHNYFALGYEFDNYIQCDVARGNAFAYNGTGVDGNGEPWTYGSNPPVQGVTILGGPYMNDDDLDNPSGGCDESINGMNFGDGIVDNERLGMTAFGYRYQTYAHGYGEPQDAEEYYNWLTSRWNDNSDWLFGGDGHINTIGTAGPACKFIYPSASDPLNWGTNCEFPNGGYNQNGNFWSEESEAHPPGYRYGVSVTGPFTFAPGDKQSLDVAFVYARYFASNPRAAVGLMNQRIDTIRNRVMNGGIIYLPTYSVGIAEHQQTSFDVSVYPNPAGGNSIRIMADGSQEENLQMIITDLLGRSIIRGSIAGGEINTLNISQLQNGIYILTLKNKNCMVNRKLVIRR